MELLIVVAGPPGAGKTTLARPLAAALRLPLLQKDMIKEALFEALGTGDIEWSRRLSDASFEAMFAIAGELDGVVLEGNFRPEHGPALLKLHPRPVEIFCRCDKDELVRRIESRERHPGHLDDITARAVAEGVPSDEPLRLGGPFLKVDTTKNADGEKVVAWVSELLDV